MAEPHLRSDSQPQDTVLNWGEARQVFEAALRRGRQGGPGVLIVSDMDGSTTQDPVDGYALSDAPATSRIHPAIVDIYTKINHQSGSQVMFCTGGSAKRTAQVFKQSGLGELDPKGVEAHCGYGRERVIRDATGALIAQPHPWSDALEYAWIEVADALGRKTGYSWTLDGSEMNAGFFLEIKGTAISIHERTALIEELADALAGIDITRVVNSAIDGPNPPEGLVGAVRKGININAKHIGLVELDVQLEVNKGSVLSKVFDEYVQRRAQQHGVAPEVLQQHDSKSARLFESLIEHYPTVIVIADDEGDKPMLQVADSLRRHGAQVIKIVIDNPPHPTKSKWLGTSGVIKQRADLVISQTVDERGHLRSPQENYASLLASGLERALQPTRTNPDRTIDFG